jgi:hypothetical protein
MRTICQHCHRPITYSERRMEWWHNDKVITCNNPQPTPGWYQARRENWPTPASVTNRRSTDTH